MSESPLPPFGDERCDSARSFASTTRRKSSGGGSADISSLANADHTKETPDTHFIRAVTGRGSIKRGPAPTKASQLRQLVRTTSKLANVASLKTFYLKARDKQHDHDCALAHAPRDAAVIAPISRTSYRQQQHPNQRQSLTPTGLMSRSTPNALLAGAGSSIRRSSSLRSKTPNSSAAAQVAASFRHHAQPSPSAFGFQPVVKPSVVRPGSGSGSSSGASSHRPSGFR